MVCVEQGLAQKHEASESLRNATRVKKEGEAHVQSCIKTVRHSVVRENAISPGVDAYISKSLSTSSGVTKP